MRVVIDANILVRALLNPYGNVWPLLERLRAGQSTLLYSVALLQELLVVLRRTRMRTRYNIDEDTIQGLRSLIVAHGVEVFPDREIRASRDPHDDMFLEVAVAGRADVIVSGDGDLLDLNPFEKIPIVRPAAFFAMLDSAGTGA